MDEQQFKEISTKIDLIVRLLALSIIKDSKLERDKIVALSSFGFGPSEIARLIGKAPNIVTAVLSDMKKRTKQGESKPSRNTGPTKTGERNV